jgi:hypothetical protein
MMKQSKRNNVSFISLTNGVMTKTVGLRVSRSDPVGVDLGSVGVTAFVYSLGQ